jgi:hypothetical protein
MSTAEGRGDLAATLNTGVPNSAAMSLTVTPPMDTAPSSPRTVLRGHTFGANATTSAAVCGRGGAPPWWTSSACLGPAGCAITSAPGR